MLSIWHQVKMWEKGLETVGLLAKEGTAVIPALTLNGAVWKTEGNSYIVISSGKGRVA